MREGLQFKAVAWIDEASSRLRESNWSGAFRAGEVDVLDALRSPLLVYMLPLMRGETQRRGAPSLARRAWQGLRRVGFQSREAWKDHAARRESPPPRPADILLWPQGATHLRQLLPIAESLRSLGSSTTFVVNRSATFELARRREPQTAFAPRAWPRPLREARERALAAAVTFRTPCNVQLPEFNGNAAPAGWNEKLAEFFAWGLPEIYQAQALVERALVELRPRVLVVGNDITLEGRTQCIVAKAHGVPTVCPMHGMVSGEPLQGEHRADAVLVYGQRSRDELVALGEDAARIRICGAPHLQARECQSHQVHPQIARFLQLSPGQKWILLATSGPGHSISLDHHRQVIEAVMRVSAQFPAVRFVAKLHPKDRVEYYHQASRSVPDSRLVVFTNKMSDAPKDFNMWLQGCSGVITGGSTAGLDALLLDVPVISVDLAGELTNVDFIEAGATQHVTAESQLQAAIERLVQVDPILEAARMRADVFLREAFHALDGDPARIAAEAIVDAAGGQLERTTCKLPAPPR